MAVLNMCGNVNVCHLLICTYNVHVHVLPHVISSNDFETVLHVHVHVSVWY